MGILNMALPKERSWSPTDSKMRHRWYRVVAWSWESAVTHLAIQAYLGQGVTCPTTPTPLPQANSVGKLVTHGQPGLPAWGRASLVQLHLLLYPRQTRWENSWHMAIQAYLHGVGRHSSNYTYSFTPSNLGGKTRDTWPSRPTCMG
jgi:hypothetical protein